jgi:hypothetical protein
MYVIGFVGSLDVIGADYMNSEVKDLRSIGGNENSDSTV